MRRTGRPPKPFSHGAAESIEAPPEVDRIERYVHLDSARDHEASCAIKIPSTAATVSEGASASTVI